MRLCRGTDWKKAPRRTSAVSLSDRREVDGARPMQAPNETQQSPNPSEGLHWPMAHKTQSLLAELVQHHACGSVLILGGSHGGPFSFDFSLLTLLEGNLRFLDFLRPYWANMAKGVGIGVLFGLVWVDTIDGTGLDWFIPYTRDT